MKKNIYILLLLLPCFAYAATDSVQQRWNLHFQTTYIYQYKPAFSADYSGPNSLNNREEKQNSVTATLYAGARLWKGAQVYINPEIAGGSALSGAFGMAASTNGETFRVGDPAPTLYLARGYVQQTFNLGNTYDTVQDGANQLGGHEPKRYLRLVGGKFSLGDFFDNNAYSGSPRTQFMNWALMSNAAWDYAANLRGYTAGGVAILQWDKMTYKLAVVTEPTMANGANLNDDFGVARGINGQVERQMVVHKRAGHMRLLAYHNQANMGIYKEAILHASQTGGVPVIVADDKIGRTKTGLGLNIDQQLTDNLGAFMRAGWNDGKTESWAFTEADRTLSLGISLAGGKWKRKDDVLGAALVLNGLSGDHRNYLAAGGMGFQLGDGNLNYGYETVTEVYYSCKPIDNGLWFSADYQFALNPGYNKDRGPVNVFSLRVHVEL